MNTSLIITTYNWPEALELVLKSVFRQSVLPNEIVIADDGSTTATESLISKIADKSPIPIIHSWQEDKGFRVARCRNKAIARASNEYIICIDGDLILHRDFIKDHLENAKEGIYTQGSRVFLRIEYSKKILKNKDISQPSIFSSYIENRLNVIRLPFLTKILFSRVNKNLRRVRSCNFSMFRKDIVRVNGFNEDFTSWGQEDSEFVQRLYFSGVRRRDIKFSALQFHIYHKRGKSNNQNISLLNRTIDKGLAWCENGISNHLSKND